MTASFEVAQPGPDVCARGFGERFERVGHGAGQGIVTVLEAI